MPAASADYPSSARWNLPLAHTVLARVFFGIRGDCSGGILANPRGCRSAKCTIALGAFSHTM